MAEVLTTVPSKELPRCSPMHFYLERAVEEDGT